MLALVNSPSPIRLVAPALSKVIIHDLCVGVPSCGSLVQHELLKVVRQHAPHLYLRAGRELGLTLERTQALIEHRVQIVSSVRAIKLARLIAYEPDGRELFGAAGRALCDSLNRDINPGLKTAVRCLPRAWRVSAALHLADHYAHKFAGSISETRCERTRGGVLLALRDGVFADRLDTLGGAHAYYRSIFEAFLRQFAHVDCEVAELRTTRVRLNRCNFKIVWEA